MKTRTRLHSFFTRDDTVTSKIIVSHWSRRQEDAIAVWNRMQVVVGLAVGFCVASVPVRVCDHRTSQRATKASRGLTPTTNAQFG